MTGDGNTGRASRGPERLGRRRRHDLELLAIPIGLLLVMTVLALLDTVRPSLF
jgi:hypothetical protein